MIVLEERLKELFDTLPPIVGDNGLDYKPVFDFGTEEDLVRFLKDLNKQGKKYPLIWLQTPISQKGNITPIYTDLKIVLATETNSTASNTERLKETFKNTLFPLLENVKKAFRLSGFIRIIDSEKNIETKYYNYTNNEKHTGTDIWDAIKFECELRVTDCPQRNINY